MNDDLVGHEVDKKSHWEEPLAPLKDVHGEAEATAKNLLKRNTINGMVKDANAFRLTFQRPGYPKDTTGKHLQCPRCGHFWFVSRQMLQEHLWWWCPYRDGAENGTLAKVAL